MRATLLVFSSLLLAAPVLAQRPPPPPAPPMAPAGPVGPGEGLRAALRGRVRALVLDRVTRQLNLDAATAARVAAIYDAYEARELPIRQQVRRDRRQLVAITRGLLAGDDATINRLVDGVVGGRARLRVLDDERIQAVRRVLPPMQFAQLVLSMPLIKAEIQREMMRALRRGGPAAGGPVPGAAAEPFPDGDDDYE